ncbi:MAG: hypothetical protein FWD77_08255 [Betaproteobacteria bacterium]|nr:hypothetical protein [Betaproteobacteria bacterium]
MASTARDAEGGVPYENRVLHAMRHEKCFPQAMLRREYGERASTGRPYAGVLRGMGGHRPSEAGVS